ncbi:MAG: hypothetical protein WC495_07020 [Patescibacteria group bacterium]|jgi:hypothetical protein
MIPQSCPLNDKSKLYVTLHTECKFTKEGEEPFTEMCKGCPFNPEVIEEKRMSGLTVKDYKSIFDDYLGLLFTQEEKKLIKAIADMDE